MIVKKTVFNKIGLFNQNYNIAMDFDFVARLVKNGFSGFYVSDRVVVKMEGSGRSISREFEAIRECYKSLKQNNLLNIENGFGLLIRFSFFTLRKIMILIGLESLLTKMKRRKHSIKNIQ